VKLFERAGPHSERIRCRVCGATGYDVNHKRSWKRAHLRGHAPCPHCGKPMSLMTNGKPRTHTRCPEREPKWGSTAASL
jgi:hypothetical protein